MHTNTIYKQHQQDARIFTESLVSKIPPSLIFTKSKSRFITQQMSSSPVDTSFFDEQALSQKQVIMMASKTVEMLEPNPSNVGYPPPPAPRNPVDLWTKAKRNITIRRKISQHFLPKSVSFFSILLNTL